jgi:predicted porin
MPYLPRIRTLCWMAGLGAAAVAAQAQSNVTVYGLVDAAVEHINHVGADGAGLTRMPGLSGSAPSRLGFRGTEDLGNGLKAIFTLEMGMGVDSGTFNQGGRAFGRQAFVGLSGDWGTLSLGRQYSMLFYSQLDADILGPNLYGSGSLDSYLPNARVDNAIAYRGKWGGLELGGTYSFGRDAVNAGPSLSGTNCAGENAADSKACRQWSVMAKYNAAQWGVAAAVDEIRGGTGAFAGLNRSDLKDRRATVAAWFKPSTNLKLGAGLIARDNDANATQARSNLWYVGAAYNVTPAFTLDGQVFKLDYRHTDNAATMFALRGTYALSKRTAAYITAGHVSNDGVNATAVSNGAAGGNPAAGSSQTGVAIGMRHSF